MLSVFLLSCRTDSPPEWDKALVIRLDAAPKGIHPLLTRTTAAKQIESQLFLPLLQFDPNTLELIPMLAKKLPVIETSKEGVSYSFEIQEAAKWDDGQPVTAKDYEFTIKALLNPYVPTASYRVYLDFLADITIDQEDPKRFTIYTNGANIQAETALGTLPIYPAHLYDTENLLGSTTIWELLNELKNKEKEGRLKLFANLFTSPPYAQKVEKISGCGPYRLSSWDAGQQLVLKKKKRWWGDGLEKEFPLLTAEPKELVYKIVPDAKAALTLLKASQLDVITGLPPNDYHDLQENQHVQNTYQFLSPSKLGYYYIGLNGNNEKLKDKNVRRALAHLVDVEQIIKDLLMGMGQRLSNPIHPAKSYYNHDLPLIEHNISQAKKLLEAAGWGDSDQDGILDKKLNGRKVAMNLRYQYKAGNQTAENIGLLLQKTASKVGVGIQLEAKEFNALVKGYRQRDYDLVYMAWFYPPGLDDLKGAWHTSSDVPGGGNRTGFGNAKTDEIIDKIRVTFDSNARRELYLRIQEDIHKEQPYIFLYTPLECMAIHKRFDAISTVMSPGFIPNKFQLSEVYSSK